jgi:PTS system nitrogen regulatory IIA component
MGLASLIRPELVFPDLPGSDRQAALRFLSDQIAAAGFVEVADSLYQKLCEREGLGSTCVGHLVAIPHCKLEGLDEVLVSVAISADGVEFGAEDGAPVRLFFTVISPDDAPAAHLQSLALISRWIKSESNVAKLITLSTGEEILDFLERSEATEE